MHAGDFVLTTLAMLGLSGGHVVLILGAIVFLFGKRFLLRFLPPMHSGAEEFRRPINELSDRMESVAENAGRSLGGIYGKPAAEAITSDNHVAELYEPAAVGERDRGRAKGTRRKRWFRYLFTTERGRWILAAVAALTTATAAVLDLHPVIAAQLAGSPTAIWMVDAFIGALAIVLVASISHRLMPRS